MALSGGFHPLAALFGRFHDALPLLSLADTSPELCLRLLQDGIADQDVDLRQSPHLGYDYQIARAERILDTDKLTRGLR